MTTTRTAGVGWWRVCAAGLAAAVLAVVALLSAVAVVVVLTAGSAAAGHEPGDYFDAPSSRPTAATMVDSTNLEGTLTYTGGGGVTVNKWCMQQQDGTQTPVYLGGYQPNPNYSPISFDWYPSGAAAQWCPVNKRQLRMQFQNEPLAPGNASYDDFIVYGMDGVTAQDPGSPSAPGCTLSDVQLVMVARAAGFAEADLVKAVAIALAESSGKVNAVNRNPSPVSYDLGLWQINDRAHPSYDRLQLVTSPFYNAQAALAIKNAAAGWSPWVTADTGAYTRYTARAAAAVSASAGLSAALADCQGGLAETDEDEGGGCGDKGWFDGLNLLQPLKCLFIPSEDFYDAWADLRATFTSTPPGSVLATAMSMVGGFYGELTTDASACKSPLRPFLEGLNDGSEDGGVYVWGSQPDGGAEQGHESCRFTNKLGLSSRGSGFVDGLYGMVVVGLYGVTFLGLSRRAEALFGGGGS